MLIVTFIAISLTAYLLVSKFWKDLVSIGDIIKTEIQYSTLREHSSILLDTGEFEYYQEESSNGGQLCAVENQELMSRSEEAIAGIHDSLTQLQTYADESKDGYKFTILQLLQGLRILEKSLKDHPLVASASTLEEEHY